MLNLVTLILFQIILEVIIIEMVKEQEDMFRAQIQNDEKMQSKPEKVLADILKRKVNTYFAEMCLMDQGYVKDDTLTVAQALAECGKKLGATLTIHDYMYVKVGQ